MTDTNRLIEIDAELL
jgi:hypothetical protein